MPERNEMKYIRMIDNVLFCHRGVRDYFVGAMVLSDIYHNIDQAIDFTNGLHHDSMWNDISPMADWKRRVPVDRQRDLGIYLHEGIKEEQI